jgi:hypothetical protein
VRTVESHVAALLRKLGAPDRAALAEMGAALRATDTPRTALAAPLTSLIGRQSETSELTALIDAHRLVTLIGPAGVGKTRLALRIATLRAGSFRHGARLADLAPAEAGGSEDDQAHATVGFGQLAWLRGDHDRAAQIMEDCLPTLRRLGDQRCAGRALLILGERAREQGQLGRAADLLGGSVAAIALAGQSIVLVTALEALAAVFSAQGRPRQAAVLLGTARAARESASAHMRPAQPPDQELRRSLVRVLGAADFNEAHADGQRLSPAQALEIIRSVRHDPDPARA